MNIVRVNSECCNYFAIRNNWEIHCTWYVMRYSDAEISLRSLYGVLTGILIIRQKLKYWIPGKRYKVRGFWVADAKTMCFDLNEGVQEDFRPVTPSNDAE